MGCLAATACWAASFALLAPGCGFERATGDAMGTTYAIQADCAALLPRDRIDAELARINALMSTYDPHSELSRFNRAPTGVPMPVSADLVEVVGAAFSVAERTDGAFDATVAPLVGLWGFGADAARLDSLRSAEVHTQVANGNALRTALERLRYSGDALAPPGTQVENTLRLVGYRRVAHRHDPPILEKLQSATLDLSGIAKGFAVDRVAGLLDDAGCRSYLIEFGGEIRALGKAPGGGPWRIGVESPSGQDHVMTLMLEGGALATSGDYRQYRETDGVRVSHIIDPRTGYPVRHGLASVTVVAETAMMADAFATALLVMGETQARRFARDTGLAALFIVRAAGVFEVSHSEAMATYLGTGSAP